MNIQTKKKIKDKPGLKLSVVDIIARKLKVQSFMINLQKLTLGGEEVNYCVRWFCLLYTSRTATRPVEILDLRFINRTTITSEKKKTLLSIRTTLRTLKELYNLNWSKFIAHLFNLFFVAREVSVTLSLPGV